MKVCYRFVIKAWLLSLLVCCEPIIAGPCTGGGILQVVNNNCQQLTVINSKVDVIATCSLEGDVTGPVSATVVRFVGGQSATDVAAATIAVSQATPLDLANTIVLRDGFGNFATNGITIDGPIVNATDAATKDYVDAAVSSGFTVKDPVLVTSTSDVTITGTKIVDGVQLTAGDRVLLVGQVDAKENGLWLCETSSWDRPTDFATGTTAGVAYALTLTGVTQAGNGWVCSTPTAIIDTDSIAFVLFSVAGQTTGANVGAGIGQVFRDKVGQTLNFKTLAQGTHMVMTNGTDEIWFATDATSVDLPSTIIARDASGIFAASGIQLVDGGGEYVGLIAPTTETTGYTFSLPAWPPSAGQVLQATSVSTTTWGSVGGNPAVSRTYYVALNGSDSPSADGSFDAPFRTIKHAVGVANGVATAANPVVVRVGAGTFVEDNSGAAITLSVAGVKVIGTSIGGTIVVPTSGTVELFSITQVNTQISNMVLSATAASSAAAIQINTANSGNVVVDTVSCFRFQTGISVSGGGVGTSMLINYVAFKGVGTCISINNTSAIISDCVFVGPFLVGSPAANTGITGTGSNAIIAILACSFNAFNTAVSATGGSNIRVIGSGFGSTVNSIVCSGASQTTVSGSSFLYNLPGSVNVAASGSGTNAYITGCSFNCTDSTGAVQGTALQVTTQAGILANSCSIVGAATGIQCGIIGDTVTTMLHATSVGLTNCTTDIVQTSTSKLHFVGGTFEASKISIANPENVSFAAFDSNGEAILAIGNATDSVHPIYRIENGEATPPNLTYNPNCYGHKGTVYINPNAGATFNGTQAQSDDVANFLVTGQRDKAAALNLISDTGNFGVGDLVRGWSITKEANRADLAFTYSNNDESSLDGRGTNTVMRLNGFDNRVEFPTATNSPLPTNSVAQLVWAGDTNLYRSAANTLKTDSNLAVGTLAPAGVVHNDASGLLSSSLIVNADISATAAITDDKLATISTEGKVANPATTATSSNDPDTIVLRDASKNFLAGTITAALTGAASLNVLKAGDTMTGSLNMAAQSEIRLQDAAGGEYIGLQAPATVPTSYTVSLPELAPVAGQVLQATSAFTTTWATLGGLPEASETYYVSLTGNDSNDGSFAAPYRHVAKAVEVADTVASTTNPVTISVGAGLFVEDNSSVPITISAPGISIVGSSIIGTIIVPTTLSKDLLSVTTPTVNFFALTVDAGAAGSTAAAINLAAGTGQGGIQSVVISRFKTGFSINGSSGTPTIIVADSFCLANETAVAINNARIIMQTSVFLGNTTGALLGNILGSTPLNTAVTVTGLNSLVTLLSNSFRLLETGISATGGAQLRVLGSNFETMTNGLVLAGASNAAMNGCSFVTNNASSINVAASGDGTVVDVDGCNFNCSDTSGNPQGTTLQATTGAQILVGACAIIGANIGIQCGMTDDTDTTVIKATSVGLTDCTTDIVQTSTSKLHFVGGTFEASKISIANPENVSFAAFDSNGEAILAIGNATDSVHPIYRIENGQATPPNLTYNPNYYGYKGTVYLNPNGGATFNGTQAQSDDVANFLVTGQRDKAAALNLISDTGNFGVGDLVRGWSITKEANQADLAFTYSNNDSSSLADRGANTVMRLNGFDNRVEFPIATNSPLPTNVVAQLVWAGDTNLYRSAANTLRTDGNLAVGAFTSEGVVHNDATGLLSSSKIFNVDIDAAAAITDDKLATITTPGKVANSATTATRMNDPDTIVLRDASGNFLAGTITAALTGAASLNVLKAGDTMTGNLNIISPAELRFVDGGGEYVGLTAPTTETTGYTFSLPAWPPTAGQVLQATSVSTTTWATLGGLPAVNQTYYVSLAGDNANDGSFATPYRTIAYAISVANNVSSLSNPIAISVGSGFFVENNISEPIRITADGICIIGTSISSTFIVPMNPAMGFFSITTPNVEFDRLVIVNPYGGSTASAVSLSAGSSGYASFNTIAVSQFQTAFVLNSTGDASSASFDHVEFAGNGTNINIDNMVLIAKNSLFHGPVAYGLPAANTGIAITGISSQISIMSCTFSAFDTAAIAIAGGAELRVLGSDFDSTVNGIVCSGSSKSSIDGCNFLLNSASSVDVAAAGAGAIVNIVGCDFNCTGSDGNNAGTAIQATTQASIFADSSSINNAILGIQSGTTGDDATTKVRAVGVSLYLCTTDLVQTGAATLQFVGGAFQKDKLIIENTANVNVSAFNSNGKATLAIGDGSDVEHIMYEVLTGQTNLPNYRQVNH